MKRIKVTDHVVIRYLERALGFDVDRHRHKIEAAVFKAHNLGATSIRVDGVRFIINAQGSVVTCINAKSPARSRHKVS